MGIIFHRTLKCENCDYKYHGKIGGHIISNGERYSISQYYCNTCRDIIDLECYSSLRDNTEKYTYPDGTEVSYDIVKKDSTKETPPLCKKCGNHLLKLDIDNDRYACCPKCGNKTLKQYEIHVLASID